MNCALAHIRQEFVQGNFVIAYYKADRNFYAQEPKHVEKVFLKNNYLINDTPREEFIKYLLDLRMTQALAIASNKMDKAETIKQWFEKFEGLFKEYI